MDGSRPSPVAAAFCRPAEGSARLAAPVRAASASSASFAFRIISRRWLATHNSSAAPRRAGPPQSAHPPRIDPLGLLKAARFTFTRGGAISAWSSASLLHHPLVLIALCREALARSFVPSNADPQPDQLRLPAQTQRLHKQLRQRLQVPARNRATDR